VYAHRRSVLALSVIGFILSIVAIATGGEPQNANSFDFESGRGFTLMSNQLPKSGVTFTLILGDSGRLSTHDAFHQEVSQALAPLAADHRVGGIETPYTAPTALATQMVSSDGHMVLAVVSLKIDFTAARKQFGELRSEIHAPPQLSVASTGDVPLAYDFDTLLPADLEKAEIGSSAVALVLLLIVFGTGVGALVCLAGGLLAGDPGLLAGLGTDLTRLVLGLALDVRRAGLRRLDDRPHLLAGGRRERFCAPSRTALELLDLIGQRLQVGIDRLRVIPPAPDGKVLLLDGLSFEGHGEPTSRVQVSGKKSAGYRAELLSEPRRDRRLWPRRAPA